MSDKALLSPLKLGDHTLKHRVVLAPMTRARATEGAIPSDLTKEYYRQRASEGGLLVTEGVLISRLAGVIPHAPGIYNEEQIQGWKKVTDAVHEKNSVIFMQLWHLGRCGSATFNPNGEQVVSASSIRIQGNSLYHAGDIEVPRALEIDEIKALVQEYQQAAINAVKAGFDGIEVHGANGYIVDQFLNSNSNQRTDIYGGSVENRARFALEVVDAIASAIGESKTAIRFSPSGKIQDMDDANPEETWGYVTRELNKRHPNLAYLHFIEPRGDFMGDKLNFEDNLGPYREAWNGPFITAGGFSNDVKYANELAEKTGTLIAFGRNFIANPDLPQRIANDWELNKYDRSTFYTFDAAGYTDYPFYKN